MKLLVFAHTPPPHHGQSYMVKLMLDGFGGDHAGPASAPSPLGVECFHVNARVSKDAGDIGGFRPGKIWFLLGHCLAAIRLRFQRGVTTFYYVPAPGKYSAVLRDWIVMSLCRPFFSKMVFHWHAAGLSGWLESAPAPVRWITWALLRRSDVSVVLSRFNQADAEKFHARQIAVVKIGIPDPCPDFDAAILPRREARTSARVKLSARQPLSAAERAAAGGDPETVHVLYLAHCLREKGIFDTLEGIVLANQQLAAGASPLRFHLIAAGLFFSDADQAEFQKRVAELRAQDMLECVGFLGGEEKSRRLAQADLFCFPTYYGAENQPVNLIEAMAFGLPLLTTQWRSIPEMVPAAGSVLVAPRAPQEVADGLRALLAVGAARDLRRHFQAHYTLEQHLRGLAAAFHAAGGH